MPHQHVGKKHMCFVQVDKRGNMCCPLKMELALPQAGVEWTGPKKEPEAEASEVEPKRPPPAMGTACKAKPAQPPDFIQQQMASIQNLLQQALGPKQMEVAECPTLGLSELCTSWTTEGRWQQKAMPYS